MLTFVSFIFILTFQKLGLEIRQKKSETKILLPNIRPNLTHWPSRYACGPEGPEHKGQEHSCASSSDTLPHFATSTTFHTDTLCDERNGLRERERETERSLLTINK